MLKSYGILLVVLILGACAGSPETRATNALAAACDGYAVVLGQLAPLRADGALSASQVARVDAANAAVDPLCMPGSVIDPAQAVGVVRSGIQTITAIRESF